MNPIAQSLEKEVREFFGLPICLELAEGESQPLTPEEQARRDAFGSESRRREWSLGRSVLKTVLQRLGEKPETNELRFPHPSLSLTHSHGLAAAVGLPRAQRVRGVGIDLERPRDIDPRSARFFLRPVEMRANLSEDDLLRLWTVKEAIFKADPQNGAQAFDDYLVENPHALSGSARAADRSRGIEFTYFSRRTELGWVTVAVASEKEVYE